MSTKPTIETSHIFGPWSAIGLGWLTLNAFGTLSFIIVVGLPAGGVPVILYGL
jgi:choline transport protein